MLVLPAPHPTLVAGGATGFEHTSPTTARPVEADRLAVFVGSGTVGKLLPGGAAIAVARGIVVEVALAEAPVRDRVRGDRLDHMGGDSGCLACQHLRSAIVATIGHYLDALGADHVRSEEHTSELQSL